MPRTKLLVLALLAALSACKSKSGDDSGSEPVNAGAKKGKKSLGLKDGDDKAAGTWVDPAGYEWRWLNKKMKWEDADKRCEASSGASDKKKYRLPSPGELQDAIKRGISSSRNPGFGWAYLSHTWTASVYDAGVAISIDMKDGKLLHTDARHELSVVCVRTDPAKVHDTWSDDATGLVWLHEWDDRKWADADAMCKAQARTDHLPWRMATAHEIEVALKDGLQTEKNASFGRAYLGITWSADIEMQYGDEAYAIDLRNGNRFLLNKKEELVTICVRPRDF